jgi:hypothetical protein
MSPIKSILKEELANSYKLKRRYEKELGKLPEGALVCKHISGHDYYYLAVREGKKVRHLYKGKLSDKEIRRYSQAKEDRKKYRALLREAKKQISFLERSIRLGS